MHVQNILKVKGTEVATIGPDDSLADATAALRDHGVGALVVSRDGRTIDGIVSERDVVRALAAHGGSTLGRNVASAMSATVTTCHGSDTVDSMMAMMTERRIRHLPVVDDDGKLAGIISIGDVVKARVGQLEIENNQLHDYIQTRWTSISVYNGAYDTLWEANSMFGTPVELALDGTTITGTASFLEAGDPSNPPVDGEIIANC